MKSTLSNDQLQSYRENGFVVIEDFLNPTELLEWQEAVGHAVADRDGIKIPGTNIRIGEDDGVNKDSDYYGNVFDQLLNLWQTDEKMKTLMLDPHLGELAARLANVEGIRIWHDQALIKRPWANPTAWHLDTPFWSFDHREAISIWIALDDAILENGCLYFMPGTHKKTDFKDIGITKNMNAIFDIYPEFTSSYPVAVPMKAGSASFHNGLTIHGAGPNMTPGFRRAMTCAYMPEGCTFNGKKNILSDEYVGKLKIGDLLNNDEQNPLIYQSGM